MDLNELLHAHQVAVMQASARGDDADRDGHFAKVAEYARRVRALRDMDPAIGDETIPPAGPPAVIYGTYAGDAGKPSSAEPIESWEDEGGAVRHPNTAIPEEIEVTTVQQYRVGPYSYQDLDLAVAEHLRQLSARNHGPG